MKIPILKYLYIPSILFVLFFNCAEEEEVLQNEEFIFSNSFQIKIPEYQYYDNKGNLFLVRGDTSYQTAYPDTLNNMPSFVWDSIGLKIITVAIFTLPIVVENDQIMNVDDIVWEWHSGMDFGKEGYVQFIEGKNVIQGEITDTVTPLQEGNYYWGVWAWNSTGKKVVYSSRQLGFYVLN